MRYMCLVHFEPRLLDEMPLADRQDVDRRSLRYDEELKAKGHYVVSQAILGGDSAVLVRVRDGKMATTDGPYIETKEQMAGFALIEAPDIGAAVAIAGEDPIAEYGTIEVRPVYVIPAS